MKSLSSLSALCSCLSESERGREAERGKRVKKKSRGIDSLRYEWAIISPKRLAAWISGGKQERGVLKMVLTEGEDQ